MTCCSCRWRCHAAAEATTKWTVSERWVLISEIWIFVSIRRNPKLRNGCDVTMFSVKAVGLGQLALISLGQITTSWDPLDLLIRVCAIELVYSSFNGRFPVQKGSWR
jgi:hypothetical protein